MSKKKRVYVSSTFEDLKAHRQAVIASLERAGFDVECMEKYPAFDERPADKCLKDVAACDYYILVLAWRYGFQPKEGNPKKLSITHLEYQEALGTGKPCFPFLLDRRHAWLPDQLDLHALSSCSEIGKFRSAIESQHGWRSFTTPDDLAAAVQEALRAEEQKHLSDAEKSRVQIRTDYLGWLRTSCESVELLGLTLRDSQNVRLGQVYVPAVTSWGKGEREPRTSKERDMDVSESLLLRRVAGASLYVPGAPGAGKSTFCRWLAYLAAGGANPGHPIEAPEHFRETLHESLTGRFPVLCGLRVWSGRTEGLHGNGHWTRAKLEDSLAGWLDATRPGDLTGAVFREELAAGHCLLILDGVDEIPESLPGGHLPRRNFLTGLADALPDWEKRGNRVLLTSRPYGLCAEDRRRLRLKEAELADLPEDLQNLFVRRWYAAADPANAVAKADGLLRHVGERQELRELKQNPMLLTALCILWDQGQKLPDDFYTLYEALVGQVLYKRYLASNDRNRALFRLQAVALGMHRGTTQARTTPAAEVDGEEVERHLAAFSETDRVSESGAADAAQRREDLLSNSGLLLPRDGGRAAFYHFSFQEFLAASRLHRVRDDEKTADVLAAYAATPAWHRTLRFLFCAMADKDSAEAAMKGYASLRAGLDPAALAADANPALLFCDCLEVAHGRGWNLEEFALPLRGACEYAHHHLPPEPRAHLWRTLGVLGLDDRPGVGLRDGLPHIDWIEVPEGPFRYGDETETRTIPAFRIARYPITNAQYQAFLDDPAGHAADPWWQGLAERPAPARGFWSEPNAPRETVSWHEAMAYARWLDARLRERGLIPDGWRIRLPTEAEWEKAARGEDGREFPWGDWASGRANLNETWDHAGPHHQGRTSAVGLYPAGASPWGALDMAGNVWEWCLNEYHRPERSGPEGHASRAVRGGSWDGVQGGARCAFRLSPSPDDRGFHLGLRLVCVPPIA